MTLGENITRLRTEKGWSQGDLADALDVSRQSISKWETDGSVPELDKLLRLSDLFGVTLDELVRGESGTQKSTDAPDTKPKAEKSGSRISHTQAIVGAALLWTGVLIIIAILLLGGSLAGFLYAAPCLLCGLICLTVRRHTGLWCAWAVYLSVDLYLRYATGLNWTVVRQTVRWEASWNYARLAVAWGQFLAMLALIVCTVRAYREMTVEPTGKRVHLLLAGYFAFFVALPVLMSNVIAPPLREIHLTSSWRFTLYFPVSILYSYLHLALLTFLLVTTFAMLRWKRQNDA